MDGVAGCKELAKCSNCFITNLYLCQGNNYLSQRWTNYIKLKAKTCLTIYAYPTSLSCFHALSFPPGFKWSILDPSYSVDWSPIIFWGACPLRDHLKGKMLLSKLFGQMAVSRKQTNLPVIRWCQNIREIKGRLSRKWSATPLGCFRRAFYPHLLPQCVKNIIFGKWQLPWTTDDAFWGLFW